MTLKKLFTRTIAVACFVSLNASGQSLVTGAPLPLLEIEERGEISILDDKTSFQPWSSTSNPGKVHVVQYVAATKSASDTYSEFTDELAESFNPDNFHVTTIVNLDDAMWGTGGFVMSELKSSKKEFPLSTIVVDDNGSGITQWGLTRKSAAIAILDKAGTVVYFTDKPMSEGDLETMIALMKTQIES